MTPEQAEEIFYKAYREEQSKQSLNWSKPVIQKEVRLKAYQSLISEIENEFIKRQAEQYLSRS